MLDHACEAVKMAEGKNRTALADDRMPELALVINFNRMMSHSKLFDITRLGAAGIYSNVTPYREKVIQGQTRYLCTNEPDKWVAALTRLLNNEELRTSLYLKAKDWCKESCSSLPV